MQGGVVFPVKNQWKESFCPPHETSYFFCVRLIWYSSRSLDFQAPLWIFRKQGEDSKIVFLWSKNINTLYLGAFSKKTIGRTWWAVMVIMSYFGVKTDYAQHGFSFYVACSWSLQLQLPFSTAKCKTNLKDLEHHYFYSSIFLKGSCFLAMFCDGMKPSQTILLRDT